VAGVGAAMDLRWARGLAGALLSSLVADMVGGR
jgi:hypothetical protein